MNFDTFKITNPGAGEIDLFISGGSNVAGITISTSNCTSTNFTYTIQQANSITINGTEFSITEKVPYTTHFFLETALTPFNTGSESIGSGGCIEIEFSPFLQPVPFTYNDYNATLGNSEDIRTTDFIFDVDRTNDQIVPLNIENILSGNGTPAKFVESNHTDTGLTNARYNGSKTTIGDYGTIPSFTAIPFNGSTYGIDTTNQLICSQSSDNRIIKDLLYSPNPKVNVSSENLEEVPQIRYESLGAPTPAETIQNTESYTLIKYNTFIDVAANDIIRIGGSSGEVMKVVEVSVQTSSRTEFTVIRAYRKDINSSNTATLIGTTTTKFEILLGDTIYNAESNQVYRLNDKKLWVQESLQIFYVDETGRLLFELETCTV